MARGSLTDRLPCCRQVPLSDARASASGSGEGVDEAPPEQEEVARVAQVVAATAQPDYWVSASMDGNREEHYRGAIPSLRAAGAAEQLPLLLLLLLLQMDDAVVADVGAEGCV